MKLLETIGTRKTERYIPSNPSKIELKGTHGNYLLLTNSTTTKEVSAFIRKDINRYIEVYADDALAWSYNIHYCHIYDPERKCRKYDNEATVDHHTSELIKYLSQDFHVRFANEKTKNVVKGEEAHDSFELNTVDILHVNAKPLNKEPKKTILDRGYVTEALTNEKGKIYGTVEEYINFESNTVEMAHQFYWSEVYHEDDGFTMIIRRGMFLLNPTPHELWALHMQSKCNLGVQSK